MASGGGGRRRWPLLTPCALPLLCPLLPVIVALPIPSLAKTEESEGYGCWADRAAYPCRAYAFYRAAAPDMLDLAAVGDLFSVSRAMIANATGIPTASAAAPLPPGQPLLVPLTCNFTGVAAAAGGNRSYALLPYQIKAGDTFYLISTVALQNLTTWQAVELVNPSLVPTELQIGTVAVFPVFCQCPRRTAEYSFFITYVPQPSDIPSSIASLFGADPRSILAPNSRGGGGGGGREFAPFTPVLVPVSRLPVLQLQQQQQLAPPPSPSPSEKDGRGAVVAGLAVGVGVMGVMFFVAVLWGWKKKRGGGREKGKQKRGGDGDGDGDDDGDGDGDGDGWGGRREARVSEGGGDLMAEIVECLDRYRVFDIEDVRQATSGFDEGCRVGGSVYRGYLDGATYAVKRLNWNACQELRILQKVNHTNLVKLEGFSIDLENVTSYLVYEFIKNGSLHWWLHNNHMKLEWRTRLRIALDIACGLQYIHEHTWPKVVHMDIKSSNILLDENMRAKIANFGLTMSGSNAMTTQFVGTHGYVAPEYVTDGLVTTKMDVFAYGVILLELVSGKEAVNKDGEALWIQVERGFQGEEEKRHEELRKWVDDELVMQHCPLDSIINVLAIARACSQADPSKRPGMVDVAYSLSKSDDLYIDFSGDGPSVSKTLVAR